MLYQLMSKNTYKSKLPLTKMALRCAGIKVQFFNQLPNVYFIPIAQSTSLCPHNAKPVLVAVDFFIKPNSIFGGAYNSIDFKCSSPTKVPVHIRYYHSQKI